MLQISVSLLTFRFIVVSIGAFLIDYMPLATVFHLLNQGAPVFGT